MEGFSFEEQKKNIYRNFKPKYVLWALAAVFILIVVFTGVFIVDQKEQAVVLRFGQYVRTVGPGLQFKIPLGIESRHKVETQLVQTLTFGYRNNTAGNGIDRGTTYLYSDYTSEATMLTGDLNIIDVEWIVQYKIDDPYKWLFSVNNNENTISDISRSVINQLVGDLPILGVMTSERTGIEVEAQQKMQSILDSYNMGIKIVTVKLQDIVPPAGDVQDAFEDVNKAIQDMNKLINEGKENYNSVIPAAQGEASREIQEAQGYASERVNNALGDVARFNSVKEEYEKSKAITSERLYLETMEEIFSGNSDNLTIIDKNLSNFLPLSEIKLGGAE